MNTEDIRQSIRELARANYHLYSDGFSYKPEGGELTEEEMNIAETVAEGYWDNRDEQEMKRDKELGITAEDYCRWVVEAIREAAIEKSNNF